MARPGPPTDRSARRFPGHPGDLPVRRGHLLALPVRLRLCGPALAPADPRGDRPPGRTPRADRPGHGWRGPAAPPGAALKKRRKSEHSLYGIAITWLRPY